MDSISFMSYHVHTSSIECIAPNIVHFSSTATVHAVSWWYSCGELRFWHAGVWLLSAVLEMLTVWLSTSQGQKGQTH